MLLVLTREALSLTDSFTFSVPEAGRTRTEGFDLDSFASTDFSVPEAGLTRNDDDDDDDDVEDVDDGRLLARTDLVLVS